MTSRTHTPEDMQKIMESWRDSASDYERGFIDGMQYQIQTTVNKAVNAMTQPTYYIPNKNERTWVGLTELEKAEITSLKWWDWEDTFDIEGFIKAIETKLKEKNNG